MCIHSRTHQFTISLLLWQKPSVSLPPGLVLLWCSLATVIYFPIRVQSSQRVCAHVFFFKLSRSGTYVLYNRPLLLCLLSTYYGHALFFFIHLTLGRKVFISLTSSYTNNCEACEIKFVQVVSQCLELWSGSQKVVLSF